jgi:3-oxoacyl-(acyl-carrier-protein) synthase
VSEICVCGYGAVSPAGWGVPSLSEALARGEPLPTSQLPRPSWSGALQVRTVPPPSPRPDFLGHPRLRRSSPIAQYAVAAGLEAVRGANGEGRGSGGKTPLGLTLDPRPSTLGVVLCVMSGCVSYCRRFYDEVLKDPPTASPLVFPETVFNSPASHIAAILNTTAINYTLVGDPGTFLQGLALAADWLMAERVDACLVIGAEELDWLMADACWLFERQMVVSHGAGALFLRRRADQSSAIHLEAVTHAYPYSAAQSRAEAARRARAESGKGDPAHLLCNGCVGARRSDLAEQKAWSDWPGARLSPKMVLGEGLMAAAAWQCVAAVAALDQGKYPVANVSVVGCNQQAIAAQFVRRDGSIA